MSGFRKAEKRELRARVGLIGPAGSGKTYSALLIGKALAGATGRIAVIDTERRSASKYAGDVADFDVLEPETFEPRTYMDAIADAAAAGYEALVIDSLSHAWEGEGGILDQVDKKGGRFDAWKDMTPQTRSLIDALLTYPGHVIATMRVKTEWVVEDVERNGKTSKVPRKIGLAPRFKEGLEYELDIVGTLDDDNCLHISKSRCPGLTGQAIRKPGAQLAATIAAWLSDGKGRVKALTDAYEQATDSKALLAARGEVKKAWKGLTAEERKTVEAAAVAATQRITAAKPPPGAPADHGDEEMPEDLFGGAAQ